MVPPQAGRLAAADLFHLFHWCLHLRLYTISFRRSPKLQEKQTIPSSSYHFYDVALLHVIINTIGGEKRSSQTRISSYIQRLSAVWQLIIFKSRTFFLTCYSATGWVLPSDKSWLFSRNLSKPATWGDKKIASGFVSLCCVWTFVWCGPKSVWCVFFVIVFAVCSLL